MCVCLLLLARQMKLSGLVLVKWAAYWFRLILLLLLILIVMLLLDHGIWLIMNDVPKSMCTGYLGVR